MKTQVRYLKFLLILIFILLISVITGCSNSSNDATTPVSGSSYHDLYIIVKDSSGSLTDADSITLLDGNTILATSSGSRVSFNGVETGTYMLVVGKEGCFAEIRESLYVDNDQNINITLNQGKDITNITFNIMSDTTKLEGVKVTALREDASIIDQNYSLGGTVELTGIQRGVLYNYRFEKEGYQTLNARKYI